MSRLMKRMVYVLFFIVIAAAILGILGIISLPPFNISTGAEETKANTSLIIRNQSDIFTGIRFDAAASRVLSGLPGMDENATVPGIRMIQGYDVDGAGNASSWNIIVCQPNLTVLVTCDRNGVNQYTWFGKCPEQEIDLARIITPEELFRMNQGRIFQHPESDTKESREITLAGNTYYLTISGPGTEQDLEFDAMTGAMISTND